MRGRLCALLVLACLSASAASSHMVLPQRLRGGGVEKKESGWSWPWPANADADSGRSKPPTYKEATNKRKDTPTQKAQDFAKDLPPGLWDTVHNIFKHIETPGIKWDLRPERTKLKLRKRLYPLGLTRLTVGADYDPLAGEWSIKTSWKDTVVGGNLNIHGTEVALTKDFKIDDRNALWLKAAFDWHTKKSLIGFTLKPSMGLSARVGSDRAGWSFRKRVPLMDKLQLEVDSLIEMPEATYTTSSSAGICLGIGDFKVDVRELNLVVEL